MRVGRVWRRNPPSLRTYVSGYVRTRNAQQLGLKCVREDVV